LRLRPFPTRRSSDLNGTSSASGRGAQPRGQGNIFNGCHFYNNRGNGVYAFSNTNAVFSGCVFYNNAKNGASGANGAGIQMDTCRSEEQTSELQSTDE